VINKAEPTSPADWTETRLRHLKGTNSRGGGFPVPSLPPPTATLPAQAGHDRRAWGLLGGAARQTRRPRRGELSPLTGPAISQLRCDGTAPQHLNPKGIHEKDDEHHHERVNDQRLNEGEADNHSHLNPARGSRVARDTLQGAAQTAPHA